MDDVSCHDMGLDILLWDDIAVGYWVDKGGKWTSECFMSSLDAKFYNGMI